MGGSGVRSEETGQPAGRMRGTKGDGRNESRCRQMGGGGVRRGNATTSRTRGLEGRDEWPESSVGTANGSLMARYGARRQWTAQRLLDGEGRRDGSSTTVRDGATAPRRRGTARARRRWTVSTTAMGSDGEHDGEWTVMDDAALRRWMARRQLDGEERRDGDLTKMDNEERRERDGDVNTAGGGSNKGQRVITL